MITRKRIEILQSAAEGGIINDEMRLNYGFMKSLLNVARGYALAEIYKDDNNIDEGFMQPLELSSKDIVQDEDECWTVFSVPQIEKINKEVNGAGYIGSARGDMAWRQVRNFSEWALIKQKDVGNMSTAIYWIPEPQEGLIRVSDPAVKRAFAQFVWADPFDDRLQFNEESDPYPITNYAFSLVEKYVRTGFIRDIMRSVPNVVSNAASDAPQTAIQQ